MVRLTVRVDFGDAGSMGPGKARLLELVEKEGSIRRAAMAMEMSYRQAWLLVQSLDDMFSAPIVETATGGTKGGGARLTELGQSVLHHYRAIEKKATTAAASDLKAMEKLAKGEPTPGLRKLSPRMK